MIANWQIIFALLPLILLLPVFGERAPVTTFDEEFSKSEASEKIQERFQNLEEKIKKIETKLESENWFEQNIVAIVALCGSGSSGYIAYRSFRYSRKKGSADIIDRYIPKIYEEKNGIVDKLEARKAGKNGELTITEVTPFLNDLEAIAHYLEDGVISDAQVKTNFGPIFALVANDDICKQAIKKWRESNEKFYQYLIKYFEQHDIEFRN